ncbi:hypothetical protein G8E03_10700 [Pontibrevibacter nitratireducens]|uniref:Uncharacterized protein n=1 Tax=Pontivivens nitratireducens TaxID=2758038 RepID=A0A6G7VMX4_9RHOB|nr:hypothetical protein G8E03_10700 [Pontibrevibacter nitratireducens]
MKALLRADGKTVTELAHRNLGHKLRKLISALESTLSWPAIWIKIRAASGLPEDEFEDLFDWLAAWHAEPSYSRYVQTGQYDILDPEPLLRAVEQLQIDGRAITITASKRENE